MHGELGFDLEAARCRRERLGESTRQHAIPREHVARPHAEQRAEERVERAVAEAMAAAIGGATALLVADGRHHVEVVDDELVDQPRSTRSVVSSVAVDDHVDIGVDLAEHPSHDATFARARLAADDRAGASCDVGGAVTRAVVVHMHGAFRERGAEIRDDRRDRRRFVAARHEHRNARRRRQPASAARERRARSISQPDTI